MKTNVNSKKELPTVISFDAFSKESFIHYYLENRGEIEKLLLTSGCIKFVGVTIDTTKAFQQLTNSISSEFLDYIDGNSPRTKLEGKVYSSTEYDPTRKITMHNELSYSSVWPNKIFFSCIQPAESGGETLLVDSRTVLKQMDGDIVSKISERGIVYVRNLHGGNGLGPSWQDTFETKDKMQLEKYCIEYNIKYTWKENGNLRLEQFSTGVIKHRKTKEEVWFNQIDQFHPLHLGEELYETMMLLYGSPDNFPMYVSFGDGTEIEKTIVEEIMHTIEGLTVAPVWNKNELLMIDNELIGHGRNPFKGERRVLVAMSN